MNFLINCFSFSGLTLAQVIGGTELSETQRVLLETLPPDQRESILGKMRQADGLKEDLEDTFEQLLKLFKEEL